MKLATPLGFAALVTGLAGTLAAQGAIPFSGTYTVAGIWGEADSDCFRPGTITTVIGGESGTVTFQTDGTYSLQIIGAEVCGSGTASSGSDTGSGTYSLDTAGTLLLDPGTADESEFAMAPDLSAAVGSGTTLVTGPFLATLVRQSAGLSESSLSGRFHFAELGLQNDGTGLQSWIEIGILTFDGAGTVSVTASTKKLLDAAGNVTYVAGSTGGAYTVAADGTLAFGASSYPGAVTGDGQLFIAGDNTGQDIRLIVGFPEPTAATAATLGGEWIDSSLGVEAGIAIDLPAFYSTSLDIDVDPGLGALSFVGTSVYSDPFGPSTGPDAGNGTYTVAPDGTLAYFDSTLPVGAPGAPGAVSAAGKVAFLTNLSLDPELGLDLLLHVGPAPTPFGTPTPGTGGLAPVLSTSGGYAYLGNPGFGFQVAGGLGSAPGALGISLGSLAPTGVPALGGMLWIDPFRLVSQPGFLLSGTGSATVPAALPADPALDGLAVFSQAFVLDGGAAGGVAMSSALQVTLTR